MFVGILLRDPARDFGVEFESLRHREIFEISARGQKTIGSHLKLFLSLWDMEWNAENHAHICMESEKTP